MPPLTFSRHVRAQARPDYTGVLVLGVRARVEVLDAADDIYIQTLQDDTPAAIAARAWPTLRIPPHQDPARLEGFSPAELWWIVLDLMDLDDPLVPIEGGQRIRLPSADRVRREILG